MKPGIMAGKFMAVSFMPKFAMRKFGFTMMGLKIASQMNLSLQEYLKIVSSSLFILPKSESILDMRSPHSVWKTSIL
jgi:hypothetical protein